jgi:hypothetical protein
MLCKSCGSDLPVKRVELGFKHCVLCSDVEAYGTIDIVYHKTGNTVEHVDKTTADKVNKISKRSGFGSALGKIKSGGVKEFSGKIHKGCSLAFIGSQALFDKTGDEMMFQFELHGYDKAILYLERCHRNASINTSQYVKLKNTLEAYSQL